MGRILKKVLVGSGLAISVFLAIIFLFGDSNTVSLNFSETVKGNINLGFSDKLATNLTKSVTNDLALQLLNDNPEGPQLLEDGAPLISLDDPDQFIKKAVAAETNQISLDDFIPEINEQSILLNTRPSDQDRLSFIIAFLESVKVNLKTTLTQTDEPEKLLAAMISERTILIESLYQIKVPNDFVEIHQEFLTIIGTQINIFSALKNYQEDPLKALLAARFQAEVAQNLKSLEGRIIEYLKIHNLDA